MSGKVSVEVWGFCIFSVPVTEGSTSIDTVLSDVASPQENKTNRNKDGSSKYFID